jgi:putative FmdB family regulatory protein
MPVYEYRCRTCEHQFEIQQSITDDNLTECPECGGDLRKVFAPVGIAFKGSGFYKNDARSGSSSKSTSTSGSGTGSGSGDSGSTAAASSSSSATPSSDSSSSTATPASTPTGGA